MCIYIYMDVYLCVFVDRWPRRGSYLWHLWSWVVVSRRPFFVYLSAKTTQRAEPTKPATPEEKDEESQSISGETQKRAVQSREAVIAEQRVSSVIGETPNQSVRSRGSRRWGMARWVSIFGSYVGLSQSSCVSHNKYILECLKVPNFTSWILQF